MSSRREARERVMQALYAYELGSGSAKHVIDTIVTRGMDDDRPTRQFATDLFLRTIDRTEMIDELIAAHTRNWDINRIALVDRIVLRQAICEMLTFEDIPPKVTINEAIEVVKRFSTDRSGQFINGILDAVLLDLQSAGKLHKTGRGLVGMDALRGAAGKPSESDEK